MCHNDEDFYTMIHKISTRLKFVNFLRKFGERNIKRKFYLYTMEKWATMVQN